MIWAGFIFGLLGSFHCVGMCGPIALALPMGQGSKISYVLGRLFYNGGRILTYTLLGMGAGLVGSALPLAGWQQTLSIVSGLLILLMVLLPGTLSAPFFQKIGGGWLLKGVKKKLGHFLVRASLPSMGAAGALNGLLPCGLVYLALAGALSAPGVGSAGLYMLLFGLGTLPLMLLVSLSGRLVRPQFRHFFRKSVPYVACLMGLLFILRGLNLGIPYVSPKLQQDPITKEITSSCCTKPAP
jgi:uncharacterized protein